MSADSIPQTDSIQELAEFWDTHDVTQFEAELEEVTDLVFQRDAVVRVHLPTQEAATVRNLAQAKGIDSAELIRDWVLERIRTTQQTMSP